MKQANYLLTMMYQKKALILMMETREMILHYR